MALCHKNKELAAHRASVDEGKKARAVMRSETVSSKKTERGFLPQCCPGFILKLVYLNPQSPFSP